MISGFYELRKQECHSPPEKKVKKVSGNYGKYKLAAVAAFLPWRGLQVIHP